MQNDPKRPSNEMLTRTLLDIAVESWRFAKVVDRLMSKLDAGEQARYRSQFRWFLKRLEQCLEAASLRIVNLEGQPFDPGLAATAVNIDEFDPNDKLAVDQMLEPTIMGPEGVIRTGTVTLRKL